jgi:hypothetical protein
MSRVGGGFNVKKKERKKKNFISGEIFPFLHFAKDMGS